MPIFPVTGATIESSSQLSSGQDVIDKDEFMNLLVAQLQNQDPLNPMDNAEFTAQMAQFASLEQLQNVNGNLEDLHSYQTALFNENAVSFIGKSVKAVDNAINVSNGASDDLRFDLDQDATAAYISIYDSSENLVRTIDINEALNEGEQSFSWDGTDDNGEPVSDGQYTYLVQAVGAGDTNFNGTPFYEGLVTGISFLNNGTAYLSAGDHQISVGSIMEVF